MKIMTYFYCIIPIFGLLAFLPMHAFESFRLVRKHQNTIHTILLHEYANNSASSNNPLADCIADKKNVLVVFYADWCRSCKESVPFILSNLASVSDHEITAIKVNIDKYKNLFDHYKFEKVPSFVFFPDSEQAIAVPICTLIDKCMRDLKEMPSEKHPLDVIIKEIVESDIKKKEPL